MLTKALPARIKAAGESGDDGVFEAIVATYDRDSYGDVIVPGAFGDTLAEWRAKGDPLPVLWSHDSWDPSAHIGVVEEAAERDEGLWVKGRLDIDANPLESKARQVWRLLKGRRVTQFSFAYDVLDGGPVKTDGDSIYELRRLKLYEVGPTLIGVNQGTDLLNVKALGRVLAEVKAGRVLSAKNEDLLRGAHDAIGSVLAALDSSDDGKAKPAPAKAEEPSGANAEEPNRSPAHIRLLAELEALSA